MSRAKSGKVNHNRHKKILKLAKGFRGRAKNCYRTAVGRVEKGLQYAYRDRKAKKRTFRGLWIQRINAASREHGMTYSQFMHGLTLTGMTLDRKVLADIAARDAEGFAALATQVKAKLDAKAA
ncbi:MAG: 50S ribosomal protein L20 [Rickettsiales bacterium]|nr:50S ribosomal protein L20 [Rickettsiales bacterium]